MHIKIGVPKKFPHFLRVKNAWVGGKHTKGLIYFFLIAITIVNIRYETTKASSPQNELIHNLQRSPFAQNQHEQLGILYISQNIDESGREFSLAENLAGDTIEEDTLGTSTSSTNMFSRLISWRDHVQKEIILWEAIHSQLPDFSYVSIKLASLYYQLQDETMSKKYLNNVLFYEPTVFIPKELQSIINK